MEIQSLSSGVQSHNNSALFACTETIPSLECPRCPSFQTELLTHLLRHFKSNHAYRIIRIKKLPYRCRMCDFSSHSRYLLIRHCLLESEVQKCQLCDYKSKYKSLLSLHIFTNHVKLVHRKKKSRSKKVRQVQCDHCPYRVRWKAELKYHILAKHTPANEIKWIYCNQCSSKFKLQKCLQQHVSNMHLREIAWSRCDYCAYKCKRKTELKRHILRRHTSENGVLMHECDKCLFRTKDKTSLNRHIALKHGLQIKNLPCAQISQVMKIENTATLFTCTEEIPSYECLKCPDFHTDFLTHLLHHSKFNHNDRTLKNPAHKCPRCAFTSYSRYLLIKHCLVENARQECQLCSYKSNEINLLAFHIFANHLNLSYSKRYQNNNIRRVQCEFCSYKVRWKAELKPHILAKHTPITEIAWIHCDQCTSKFKSKKCLRQHVHNKHGNNKDSKDATCRQCEFCPYRCKRKDELKVHVLRRHTSESEILWYGCEKCSFRTKEKKRLSEHSAKKHGLDAKKFMCEYCGHRAMWNYEIRSHVASKHLSKEEIKWFMCEQCPYKCKTKKGLWMHVAVKHDRSGRRGVKMK